MMNRDTKQDMVNYNGVNLQSQNLPQFHIENLSKQQKTMTSHIPK